MPWGRLEGTQSGENERFSSETLPQKKMEISMTFFTLLSPAQGIKSAVSKAPGAVRCAGCRQMRVRVARAARIAEVVRLTPSCIVALAWVCSWLPRRPWVSLHCDGAFECNRRSADAAADAAHRTLCTHALGSCVSVFTFDCQYVLGQARCDAGEKRDGACGETRRARAES